MARYFFHFRNGEMLMRDEFGIEFDSADVALAEACKAAIAMWSELLEQRGEPLKCAFEITDDSQNLLFVLPFAEVLDRGGWPKVRTPENSPTAGHVSGATKP